MRANDARTGCVCKDGTYDVFKYGALNCYGEDSSSMGELQCVPCLSCLECLEAGEELRLKAGYALYGVGTAYKCPVESGCSGASIPNVSRAMVVWATNEDGYYEKETMIGQCAVGYAGPICGKCADGYNHLKVGTKCDACDDGVIDIPLVLGMFFVLLIVGGVFISGAIKHLQDLGMITDVRLIIGFYQMLGQMDNILNVSFPEPVPSMMNFLELMFLDVRNIVRLDCWNVGGFVSHNMQLLFALL
eukprot:SAG31_NODE_724_length_12555_cov_11.624277_7_plen_246_part_00